MSDELPAGIYRHYKGPLYLVLGLAHDANADEFADYDTARIPETDIERAFPRGREVVVYIPLQLDGAHTGARIAVRTLMDFQAFVHNDRAQLSVYGTVCANWTVYEGIAWCHCGEHGVKCIVPRFKYVGARYNG